jgi:hypothetical protein
MESQSEPTVNLSNNNNSRNQNIIIGILAIIGVSYLIYLLMAYLMLPSQISRIGPDSIATGNTDIDAIGTRYDQNILLYQTQLEDGTYLLNEDGGFMLNEYRVEVQTITANNEYFTQKSLDYLDFSERNPFSEVDRY